MKIVKMIVGVIVLAGIGLFYGGFNKYIQDEKEPKQYVYLSFELPNQNTIMTIVKRTPKSKCEKWRSDYFQANKGQCVGCKVLHNICTATVEDRYLMALDQKDIGTHYILKPYKYPEITVFDNLPAENFMQACSIHKESLNTTVCK